MTSLKMAATGLFISAFGGRPTRLLDRQGFYQFCADLAVMK
jgi:hypothetical protein